MQRIRTPGQRVVQYRFGIPHEVLQVEDAVFDRALNEGEVLVKIARSTIHLGDLQLVAVKYSMPGQAIPEGRVPGLEAAGVMAEAAPGALDGTGLAIGARVAFFAPGRGRATRWCRWGR